MQLLYLLVLQSFTATEEGNLYTQYIGLLCAFIYIYVTLRIALGWPREHLIS